MKDMNKLKVIVVAAVLIVAAIITVAVNPFKFNVNYSKNVRLEVYIEKDFEINDILSIVNSIYTNDDVIVRKAGALEKTASITLRDFTEEQNEKLISQLNEKYELKLTSEDIEIYYNSNVKGRDLIKPYIVATAIAGVLILAFFGVRYRKIGLAKSVGGTIAVVCLTQLLYTFLINIFGMYINEATIVVGITIGILCLMYLVATFEKLKAKE
ncbi:MAG: hypothetical protein IKP28_01400 [Clostridia bacterium]|nr:hypothetical protein [Clostridia bacterium]